MNRFVRPLVTDTYKRAFSVALLLVFLVRALIPMGYMPAFNQGQHPTFALSFCVTGLTAATVQALALDTDQGQTEHPTHHCAFSSALGNSGPPTVPIIFSPFALFSGLTLPVLRDVATLIWLVRGPPLGSRAPPVYKIA